MDRVANKSDSSQNAGLSMATRRNADTDAMADFATMIKVTQERQLFYFMTPVDFTDAKVPSLHAALHHEKVLLHTTNVTVLVGHPEEGGEEIKDV